MDGSHLAPAPARIEGLDPRYYVDGEIKTIKLSGLPANAWVELWHVGGAPDFARAGTRHPKRRSDGRQLSSATTSPDGIATFTVRIPLASEAMPAHELWIVSPPGDVLDRVATWEPNFRTTISGTVYDDQGRKVTDGTIEASFSEFGEERTVPVRNGRYVLEGVPVPSEMTLWLSKPGWPAIYRSFWSEEVRAYWARMGGAADNRSPVWEQQIARFAGSPITIDFGGAGSPSDPDAPAYFFSARADDPEFHSTAIAGLVFDEVGHPVPSSEGLEVLAYAYGPGKTPTSDARAKVIDGRYRIPAFEFRRDATYELSLVHPTLCGQPSRTIRILPTGVTGGDATFDFGNPGSDADPAAAALPFVRLAAAACPTPWASVGVGPSASPPAPFRQLSEVSP